MSQSNDSIENKIKKKNCRQNGKKHSPDIVLLAEEKNRKKMVLKPQIPL